MKLKSYFSGTVEAAMELARKELGDDALLINARPSTPETRYLGAYEVVFGLLANSRVASAPPVESDELPASEKVLTYPSRDMSSVQSNPAQLDGLTRDVASLRREVERMARSFRDTKLTAVDGRAELYEGLISRELDAALAQAVAEGAALESLFEVDSSLGSNGAFTSGGCAIVALVGPPGVGKTTALVKLAARYGITSAKPAYIISTDVNRIAAADQLRSLASILGIGCDVVETPLALMQSIEEHRSKGLILIDTPGFATGEMEDAIDLAQRIAIHPEIDTHLVLSASMRPSDMTRIADSYAIFAPKKLLFTRMDETERYGAILSEAARRALPISFLSNGQRIPDDLEPAAKHELATMVFGRQIRPEAQRSVGASA